ncbi:MAG: Flp family type IVb pilin [Bdellovibrionota bacterium]
MLRTFTKKQKGASMVEYALVVALIAIAAVVAIRGLGNQIKTNFEDVESTLESIDQ